MKRVLIAMDFDPTAEKIAETGLALARAMDAKLILLHVIADITYYSSPDYSPIMGFGGFNAFTPQGSIDELKKAAQDFLDRVKEHLDEPEIETVVEEGDTAEAILKTSQKLNVDIIVMGSHSRRWLEKILVGSVTEKVLANTTIPIFVIPTKK